MSNLDPAPDGTAPAAAPQSRLQHVPISLFGMTMGLFGLGLALHAGGLDRASAALGIIGAALFVFLLAIYALKSLRYPAALVEDWHHPVRLSFFPAISISLLLLATLARPSLPDAAHAIWLIGAAAQGILTLVVVSAWISHRSFGPVTLSPAWFIPAVGNLVVPVAGVAFGHDALSWYFFSVGLLFWLVLLTVVFNRLIFHDPLPGKLRPTLVILIAPPAVAFLSWTQLNGGQIDPAAHILINAGYFFAALVALQVPGLLRLPFALSFWALSFPLAALTIASFRFGVLAASGAHNGLGYGLLALTILTIAALVLHTLRAARRGAICVPE
ncbi:C4-dicarboxylate ABC transporter [Aliishimia ponticola]|uniref:C4-dicarboxylate ABC transporter n=1 Tax=Aliishimia ponticola TaxID=2499833 RepID=A0A4S4NHW5_9RHOB|nr:SLAC1 anion channel family protein [Aliishimia ponticola]THH38465.1 C4-dicarboxylate ABC transporter [Aliishimia ponticola]